MTILDYTIVAAYLLGLLAMGFMLRKNRDQQDYFLAGRSIGWKPLSLSIMATQLSAVSFVSAPAFVGLRDGGGLIWLSYELAVPLAMLFLAWRLLPVMHRSGVLSVYDYLERRFDVSTRLLVSLVFQISRSFATGIMIYTISIILQGTMGLALWQSILFIGVITLIYSLQGGMKAVVYGDAIQMILIVLGALTCLLFGLHLMGGIDAVLENVADERLQAVKFDSFGFNGEGFGFWPMLFGGMVLYAAYYGCDQSEAQRSLSAKSLPDLKKMLLTAGLVRFPVTCLYCAAGLTIGTFALNTPEFLQQIPDNHPDWLMPIFIVNYLPSGIIGLLVVAIMAAAMSSLSSAINSLSVVSVEDYCRYTRKELSDSQFLWAGKLSGFFWGILTLILSFFAGDIAPTVIEAINKIGSLFYGPILATFVLAMSGRQINSKLMNVGLLAGVALNGIFWLFIPDVFWFWWNLFGFLMTLSTAVILSAILSKSAVSKSAELKSAGQHNDDLSDTAENSLQVSVVTAKDCVLMASWFGFILIICVLLSST